MTDDTLTKHLAAIIDHCQDIQSELTCAQDGRNWLVKTILQMHSSLLTHFITSLSVTINELMDND